VTRKTEGSSVSHGGKVPAVTIGFWAIKIVATTLGEVGGNAVSQAMSLGYLYSTLLFSVALIILLIAQIRFARFHSGLYWSLIVATTLTGTTLADFFDRSLGIGYLGGSSSLLALVVVSLASWYLSMGSISVETLWSKKAEMFYWVTIMFSQTLGTALGDWLADSTGLGFNGSALLICAVLAVLVGLTYCTSVSRTGLFWAAFILTRPLGATLANSLDKPLSQGGLGLSDITLSLALAIVMVVAVILIPQRAADSRVAPA
jgi:uncharacterized membrane-anchored protein